MGRGGSSRRLGAGFAVASALAWALACGDDVEPLKGPDGGTQGSGGSGGRDAGSPGPSGGSGGASGGTSSGGAGSGGTTSGGSGGTPSTGGRDASVDIDAGSGGTGVDASDDAAPSSGGTNSGGANSGGTNSGGANSGGASSGGASSGGANSGGASSGGTSSGGTSSGGTNSGGASAGGTSSGGAGGDDGGNLPPCVTGRRVVIAGDSYVSGNGTAALQPFLAALNPNAAEFRNFALGGASLAPGAGLSLISAQLDAAVRQDPDIDLLIVDGGFTDVTLCNPSNFPGCQPACSRSGATSVKACTDIASQAILAADSLFLKAAAAGVENIVFFSYPHIPAQGGGHMDVFDFLSAHLRTRCDALDVKTQGRSHCHFVDMVPPFKVGGDLNPANFDGQPIPLPSAAGAALLAKTLDTFMKTECLGQPATSSCCR